MGLREFLVPAAGKEIPISGAEEPDEAILIACIPELDELVDRKLRRQTAEFSRWLAAL